MLWTPAAFGLGFQGAVDTHHNGVPEKPAAVLAQNRTVMDYGWNPIVLEGELFPGALPMMGIAKNRKEPDQFFRVPLDVFGAVDDGFHSRELCLRRSRFRIFSLAGSDGPFLDTDQGKGLNSGINDSVLGGLHSDFSLSCPSELEEGSRMAPESF